MRKREKKQRRDAPFLSPAPVQSRPQISSREQLPARYYLAFKAVLTPRENAETISESPLQESAHQRAPTRANCGEIAAKFVM